MRRALAMMLVVGALLAPSLAQGAGATYDVVQCHSLNRGMDDAILSDMSSYSIRALCADATNENATKIQTVRAANRAAKATVRWRAPADTALVGVALQQKLRNNNGHRARLFMADNELRETTRIATGKDAATGFAGERWSGPGQWNFVAALDCIRDRCEESNVAKVWFREVKLTLADLEDPEVNVSGDLLVSGWHRGQRGVGADASDLGSGSYVLKIKVNENVIASGEGECSGVHSTASSATTEC